MITLATAALGLAYFTALILRAELARVDREIRDIGRTMTRYHKERPAPYQTRNPNHHPRHYPKP